MHLNLIKSLISDAVQAAGFELNEEEIRLDQTKTLEHGHFSTNVAMILAGKLKQAPRQVAEGIVNYLESEWIKKAEIAGPGFINLWIEQKFYTDEAASILKNLDAMLKDAFEASSQKTLVMDYSHPNIAKPMGVHHLLSTIIGDSIKKIYQRYGWKVVADNFIGDMGTQFGKLMYAIKEWGVMEAIEKDPIRELQKLYVRFHQEAEDSAQQEALEDAGRLEYLKFEQGEPEARKLWEKIRAWSLQEIQPIYDRLGVEFDVVHGESFYEDKMQPILEEGIEEGVIVEGEGGALIIPSDDPEGTPALLKKSDGATLYATRDLARIKYWEETWHPQLMMVVVDQAQSFHFEQVFFAAQKLKLTEARNVHVDFGRMQFKDGKMSTRKGNIILLTEVLDEAEERAKALVAEKGMDLSEEEAEILAKDMGINSIKYNILSQNRTTNITFDWDKMLSFEGNSAPYLMYTIARAKSILRKAEVTTEACQKFTFAPELDVEMQLMIQLLMYPDAIRRAAEDFKPNHIANYLYQLASDFNSFYNGNSILKADETLRNSRLLMTAAVIRVMEDGFGLLGMRSLERM